LRNTKKYIGEIQQQTPPLFRGERPAAPTARPRQRRASGRGRRKFFRWKKIILVPV